MGCGSSKSGQVVEVQPQIKDAKSVKQPTAKPVTPVPASVPKEKEADVVKPPSPKKDTLIVEPTKVEQKVEPPKEEVKAPTPVAVVSTEPLPNAIPVQSPEKVEEKKALPPLKPTVKETNDLASSKRVENTNIRSSSKNLSEQPQSKPESDTKPKDLAPITKITEQKLPSIKKAELLIEVDLPKNLDRPSTSSIRNRLEQSKHSKEKNAHTIQRKQELAEERRMHQQGKKLRKAREDTALVEERRNKIKELEDKKADQLRRIMVEKKKQAEQKKAQLDSEREKKLEQDTKHLLEVQEKAKQRKVEGGDDNKENTPSESLNGMNES